MVRLLDSSEADFYYHWKFITKKKLTFKFMRDKRIYWQYILILYIHMYILHEIIRIVQTMQYSSANLETVAKKVDWPKIRLMNKKSTIFTLSR